MESKHERSWDREHGRENMEVRAWETQRGIEHGRESMGESKSMEESESMRGSMGESMGETT